MWNGREGWEEAGLRDGTNLLPDHPCGGRGRMPKRQMDGSIAPGLQQGPLSQSCLRNLHLQNSGPERGVELVRTQSRLYTRSWGQARNLGRAWFSQRLPRRHYSHWFELRLRQRPMSGHLGEGSEQGKCCHFPHGRGFMFAETETQVCLLEGRTLVRSHLNKHPNVK